MPSAQKQRTIRSQLTRTFVLGVFLLAFSSSAAISFWSAKSLRERVLEGSFNTAGTLAAQSALAMTYRSPELAGDVAEVFLSYPDVAGVIIVLRDGETLMQAGDRQNIPIPPLSRLSEPTVVDQHEEYWLIAASTYLGENDDELAHTHSSVSTRPEFLGSVVLVVEKRGVQQFIGQTFKANFIVAAIVAMLVIIVLLRDARRIVDPVDRLAEVMRKAAGGDEHVRADVSGPREIQEMQSVFNKMLAAQRSWNAELAERVAERTAELERANEELHASKEAAEEANTAKSRFLSNMSHELRTPLNAIIGYSEMLIEETCKSGLTDMGADLQKVRDSGQHLLSLINEILDLARIESGRVDLQLDDIPLIALFEEVSAMIAPMAAKYRVGYQTNIELEHDVALHVDALRTKEILLNLISNAVKYGRDERGRGFVSLSAIEDGANVMFLVADTGPGLTEAQIEEVWKPFSRLEGTSAIEGTGIGLALTKRLVEVMGGAIGVKSEVGVGSTFWVSLPKAHGSEPAQWAQGA